MSNQWDIFCFVPLLGKSSSRAITFFYFTNTSPMNAFSDKILTKQKGGTGEFSSFWKERFCCRKATGKSNFCFLEVHQKATNIRWSLCLWIFQDLQGMKYTLLLLQKVGKHRVRKSIKRSHFRNLFELEQIEKSENCSYQYEILILETRLFSVFVNTWYTESVLFCEQVDFVR